MAGRDTLMAALLACASSRRCRMQSWEKLSNREHFCAPRQHYIVITV